MKVLFVALVLLASHGSLWADMIIGGEEVYVVKKGDTLRLISSKLGVGENAIVRGNGIDPKAPLRIGQQIRVNTKRIPPKTTHDGIIINIPDRTLYFFHNGSVKAFPVGLGMPYWRELTLWRTPTGPFRIVRKEKGPTWYVPGSLQWKMELEGKEVKKVVPPGPDNPLGRFAVVTSIPGILIHETIMPTSVYRFASHGCVRVLPQHMEELFEEIAINTPGEIVYIPVKIALSDNNQVFLEVHRDIYGKVKNLQEEVRRLAQERGVSERVDWEKADRIVREKSGTAEDISL